MKKIATHPVIFALLYVLFMLPTYVLPYFGSNSLLVTAATASAGLLNPATVIHLASLGILILLCWTRGQEILKPWLVVFPSLAACFDFVPVISLIPFVATVLHILAIVLGVIDGRPVTTNSSTA